MIQMNLRQVADLLDCHTSLGDTLFTGITTDSRQVNSGMLFAALPGEHFDGHDYIQQAEECGAVAVLVSRSVDTVYRCYRLPMSWQHLAHWLDTGAINVLQRS